MLLRRRRLRPGRVKYRRNLPKGRRLYRASALADGGGPPNVGRDGAGSGGRDAAAFLFDGNIGGDEEAGDGGLGKGQALDIDDIGQRADGALREGAPDEEDVLRADDAGGSCSNTACPTHNPWRTNAYALVPKWNTGSNPLNTSSRLACEERLTHQRTSNVCWSQAEFTWLRRWAISTRQDRACIPSPPRTSARMRAHTPRNT